jgi:hypothetical protein
MPDDNRYSRWADPESGSRFGVFLGACGLLAVLVAVGVLPVGDALGWATFGLTLFLWIEYCLENQARRDLTTDIAQQIHDGRVRPQDLRRARGIWQIEDQLDRTDTEYALRPLAEIAAQYERFEAALSDDADGLTADANELADLQAQMALAWVLGVRDECGPLSESTNPDPDSDPETAD